MKLWGLEPAMIIGVIVSVISLLIAYGVNITSEQETGIRAVANAVLIMLGAYVTRQQVIPTRKVEIAHGNQAVVEATAITAQDIKDHDGEKL